MNPIVVFLLVMSVAGLIDKFIGNKLGLSESFNEGLSMIGDLIIYMPGIYCIGCTLSSQYADSIAELTAGWFFDPSVPAGCLLAPDLGAYPIAVNIAEYSEIGKFSGIALSCTIGTLISFYLPIYIASVKGKGEKELITGFTYGIIVLPAVWFASGLMFGISPIELAVNMAIPLIFCIFIIAGLFKFKNITVKTLSVFGILVRTVMFGASIIVITGLFMPQLAVVDKSLATDAIVIAVKMGITLAGSLVMVNLLKRLFSKQFAYISDKLGINEWSMMGMLVGMSAGIAMLPLFSKMDRKGKILNGAFAVSGHYVLGSQMAFVAANEPPTSLLMFFFTKLAGGISAIMIAIYIENRSKTAQRRGSII